MPELQLSDYPEFFVRGERQVVCSGARKRVSDTVIAVARTCQSSGELLEKLGTLYGPLTQLGQGSARVVYALPENLVLKMCRWMVGDHDQNETELNMSQQFPEDTPMIFGRYVSRNWTGCPIKAKGINLLVAERAERIGSYGLELERSERYKELRNKFDDVAPANVGWIDGYLVIIDSGLGSNF